MLDLGEAPPGAVRGSLARCSRESGDATLGAVAPYTSQPMNDDLHASPLGADQAALLTRPVSVIAASCDAQLHPHLMRALGCRLSQDRRQVTVLLPLQRAAQVLDDLRANGRIAVVFSEPTTNLSLQLKGDDAQVLPVDEADCALAATHLERFTVEIGELGFQPLVAQTVLDAEDGIAAVRFTVSEVYEQTPGTRAGARLDRS